MYGTKQQPWTDARDERLIELFNDRDNRLREIASALAVSLSAVRRRLGELREQGRVGYRKRPVRGTPKYRDPEPAAAPVTLGAIEQAYNETLN